jgi:dCMP deaminase
MTRSSYDEYFMQIARTVATRATCDRKHVGAVIVRDHSILATGYNGSVRGMPHCDDVGHLMEDGHCSRTVHAEANAIIQAAHNGVRIAEAEIYITASPCWPCFKMLTNAGIKRIVFGEFYRDARIFEAAKTIGIDLCLDADLVLDRFLSSETFETIGAQTMEDAWQRCSDVSMMTDVLHGLGHPKAGSLSLSVARRDITTPDQIRSIVPRLGEDWVEVTA